MGSVKGRIEFFPFLDLVPLPSVRACDLDFRTPSSRSGVLGVRVSDLRWSGSARGGFYPARCRVVGSPLVFRSSWASGQ